MLMLCVSQRRIGTASVGEDRGENGTWSMLREQGSAAGGNDHSRMGPGGGGKCVRDPARGDDDEAEVCSWGVRLYVYVRRIVDDGDDRLLLQDHAFVSYYICNMYSTRYPK